ncbi:Ig-like domain-containing protein [Candidatus Dojkabacteria bacterium]|uniref:Ig-like domain-containing protein n=1 Tax=Candidatus Dojkabacteria bacterium TaxID=2099670 RepID=A0A955L7M7_9BACT|nr:Ig-like domain-containing protein [Candidatus Dojkabacteria bacterium]
MESINYWLSQVSFELLLGILVVLSIALITYTSIRVYHITHPDRNKDSHPRPPKRSLLIVAGINIFGLIILGLLFQNLFFTYPKMVYTYPAWDDYWNDYDQPIEVVFDRPINSKKLVLNLSPETSGTWKFEKAIPFLPFTRTIRFVPDETVYPGNKVIAYFTHVTNVFNTFQNREEFLQFNSVELPTVLSSTPERNSKAVHVDQEITFQLSHREGDYVDWEFKTNKEDPAQLLRDDSDVIKLVFESPLKQNENYVIKLYQIPLAQSTGSGEITKKGQKQEAYTLQFETVTTPLVSSMTPQGGGISPATSIRIEFDDAMDKTSVENAFTISPPTPGTINWEGDTIFTYAPSSQLSKATNYTITLQEGIQSSAGGITDSAINYSFETIGAVKVIGWSPTPGTTSANIDSSIRVTFDQAVDHASAESLFSIEPSVEGVFSWEGNTMIFNPTNNLGYSASHTVRVSSGVKTVSGLDSNQEFSFSFTTQPKKVEISVPLYRQVNSKECQIVATQMLLAFKGVSKSKTTIFNEMPKESVVCDAENNVWGNPNLGYVGDINGNHDCASGNRGYGVYWNPVSSYMASVGISNQVMRGMSIQQLTDQIEQGHPVMLWWQNGWSTPTDVSWYTPDGQYIYAVNGMHSEIAVGFIGPNNAPSHIIVNDPWRGRRELPISHFTGLWSYFNNTGIVVY